ncbi:dCMP deaminase [Lipingzhangella sp. LS1_29]|uniref:dCMP deaminase n=1 Tax=Lipingzhangella rawalii TaxID=2055835 RepID=A0ABU2H7G7_9ACTN|nr:dCMP deaminase [Lipingzhangella rawalii]MDS1271252.1 dCMP deaminase [Lipingzhangella rawalii]
MACRLAFASPPSPTAFRVGCVIIDADGRLLSQGYSRQHDPHDHAEEAALAAITPNDARLRSATLISSLEPCVARASRPRGCALLIADTPIPRIVYAWREPTLFTAGGGAEFLERQGRTVVEVSRLAAEARTPNDGLLRAPRPDHVSQPLPVADG